MYHYVHDMRAIHKIIYVLYTALTLVRDVRLNTAINIKIKRNYEDIYHHNKLAYSVNYPKPSIQPITYIPRYPHQYNSFPSLT